MCEENRSFRKFEVKLTGTFEDIINYICSNPEVIENGLKIIKREYGVISGSEKHIIDLLGIDKDSNYVVIEVKAHKAGVEVLEQILSYMHFIQKSLSLDKKVRGIIIANEFDEKLKEVELSRYNISLKKYYLELHIEDIK
jgi:RecB family endonuclease NucS